MEKLKIKYLKIAANQWLSETKQFRNGTPNNYIIFKTLCGLGATHGECLLYTKYNSIILEPNTPVLIGKRDELTEQGEKVYPNILVVYKGVEEQDVIKYLESDVTPKKILATPEAYISKVKPAIEKSTYNLFEDFFMLVDECDRMTKDVEYRESIIAPMDDFFKFKKKAMISATAMQPTDPRFLENGFKILKIQPQFDYKKRIDVIHTNNTLGSLKLKLEQSTASKIFIFLNSTNLIHAAIKSAGIESESKVFCAEKSVRKLKDMGFLNTSSELGGFAKFNFMTSRNYSAVDIKIAEKPDIIVVTDIFRAPHTMVDTYSDSIQIIGRFRNGYSAVVHIANFNSSLEFKKGDEAMKFLTDGIEQHRALESLKSNLPINKDSTVVAQAIETSAVKNFINGADKLNHFMIDNFLLDEKVKSFYTSVSNLEESYKQTNQLEPHLIPNTFDFDDEFIIALREIEKNLYEKIATTVHKLKAPLPEGMIRYNLGRTVEDYRKDYPEILEIYDVLGLEEMKNLNFDKVKMRNYATQTKERRLLSNPTFLAEVKSLYQIGDRPSTDDVEEKLDFLYVKYGFSKKAKSTHILNYYEAKPSTINFEDPETLVIKKQKVWKILGIIE